MFIKNNNEWGVLDSKEKHNSIDVTHYDWTLAFDAKSLGVLKLKDTYKLKHPDCTECYTRDKYFHVINGKNFPRLGNKEKRFINWQSYVPENRPIVIVNNPNYKDSEKWKRFKPEIKILKNAFPVLKNRIGQAYSCQPPLWNGTKIELTLEDVKIYRAYKNNKGKMLVSAGMKQKHISCDGPLLKTQKPMWVSISKDSKFVGYELDLLDAADYDSDGDIEFIFIHSGYNREGFTLFDSDFEERYDYYWSYH